MYPCKLNYVCLIHPQLENSRSLHPKNKADSIPKEEWHYWNNYYFRVSRIEYRHQNQSHSIWWSSKAVGSRNFPSHQLRISKAKVQSPFGKKIVGYHHCELQLYKHSKVKFKKFTCYHHFLPSQLFYFFSSWMSFQTKKNTDWTLSSSFGSGFWRNCSQRRHQ